MINLNYTNISKIFLQCPQSLKASTDEQYLCNISIKCLKIVSSTFTAKNRKKTRTSLRLNNVTAGISCREQNEDKVNISKGEHYIINIIWHLK